jgi:hypothetical protein
MGEEAKRALPRPGPWLFAIVAGAAFGCAKNVAQDSSSGKDYRNKGAKKITLDQDGEGTSRKDVVTYPGGDRVDWKVVEIPGAPEAKDGKDKDKPPAPGPAPTTGTLKIRLHWDPPRPNLDLAFDVYDQYLQRLARAKPTPGSGKRTKKVTLRDVGPGKYYIQVYAPTRGDAGTYRVSVDFKTVTVVAAAATSSEVPDPPVLPAIPEGEAPVETAGPVVPATQPTAPPVPAAQPVKARVSKYDVSGGGTLIITIDKGKNAGVETGWQGQVLGGSGQPVRGGTFTVTKVTGSEAQGKVSLSVDQIKTNNKVILSPPQ